MARCSFAVWKPLPQHGNEPSITPRVVIYHTMVGNLKGVDAYFRSGNSGGIESHFGIACPKCESEYGIPDGQIWQWMDTGEQADANYHANDFAISVETCDHYKGGTYTNPPLSDAQVDSWVRLGKWAHVEHPSIKLQRCNAWDGSGYGYHSMWGSPSNWTPATGKSCPNPTRIDQFNKIVLQRILTTTSTGGLFVALSDAEQSEILKAARQVNSAVAPGQTSFESTIEAILSGVQSLRNDEAALRRDLTVFGTTGLEETTENFAARQREILAKLDALLDALNLHANPVEPPPPIV